MFKIIIIFIFLIISFLGVFSVIPSKKSKNHDKTGRIVGGDEDYEFWPQYNFVVSISFKGKHVCGGSVISPFYILTAAHCVYGLPKEFLKMRVGTVYLDHGGFVIDVDNVTIHPEYDPKIYSYNVAILTTNYEIDPREGIEIIQLTHILGEPYKPFYGTVAGWGQESNDSLVFSKTLQHAFMATISNFRCAQYYPNHIYKIKGSFCALAPDTNTCYGDGGGPFIFEGKIFGVISLGSDLCVPGIPTILTYVPDVRFFINYVTHL